MFHSKCATSNNSNSKLKANTDVKTPEYSRNQRTCSLKNAPILHFIFTSFLSNCSKYSLYSQKFASFAVKSPFLALCRAVYCVHVRSHGDGTCRCRSFGHSSSSLSVMDNSAGSSQPCSASATINENSMSSASLSFLTELGKNLGFARA